MSFNLKAAISGCAPPDRPDPFDDKEWTSRKRQYSDDLSRLFSKAVEEDLASHFPRITSGEGLGANAASAEGIKSVDVTFNIEGLFLGLGISTKVVGLPEDGHGYTHNFKRLTEEWTLETVVLHRYMPYAIVVGMLFLPVDAMTDRVQVTSLASAANKFGGFQGRADQGDLAENMEKIFVGLFDPDPVGDGEVRFFDVRHPLGDREQPSAEHLLTLETVKDELVALFKQRNPKLRVTGMP
jgi:hypothetical protein